VKKKKKHNTNKKGGGQNRDKASRGQKGYKMKNEKVSDCFSGADLLPSTGTPP